MTRSELLLNPPGNLNRDIWIATYGAAFATYLKEANDRHFYPCASEEVAELRAAAAVTADKAVAIGEAGFDYT